VERLTDPSLMGSYIRITLPWDTSYTPTKSNLYFDISFATVMIEPAPYRLLTFHVPNLMSIFLSLGRLSKESFVTFCNKLMFYGEDLLAPRPTSKLGDQPLSAVRDCLFNIFAAALPYLEAISSLTTRHAVMTRVALNKVLQRTVLKHASFIYSNFKGRFIQGH
jgi:hypothetical protein